MGNRNRLNGLLLALLCFPLFSFAQSYDAQVSLAQYDWNPFDQARLGFDGSGGDALLPVIVSLGPDTSVCGPSYTLWARGSSGVTYLWSDGSTADSLRVIEGGLYWVVVTDSMNAMAADSVDLHLSDPQATIVPAGTVTICSGHSTMLFGPSGFASYTWNGYPTNQQGMIVSQPTTVILYVVDSFGCAATSLPTQILVNPSPDAQITVSGDSLFATPAVNYYWFKDGQPWGGNNQWCVPNASGDYRVRVENSFGCGDVSDPITINLVANLPQLENKLQVWPNPSSDNFHVTLPAEWTGSDFTAQLIDMQGRSFEPVVVSEGLRLTVQTEGLVPGTYLLQVVTAEGRYSTKVVKLGE